MRSLYCPRNHRCSLKLEGFTLVWYPTSHQKLSTWSCKTVQLKGQNTSCESECWPCLNSVKCFVICEAESNSFQPLAWIIKEYNFTLSCNDWEHGFRCKTQSGFYCSCFSGALDCLDIKYIHSYHVMWNPCPQGIFSNKYIQ